MIRSLLLQWLYLRDEIIYQILICYLLIWRKLIKDKVHWINFRSFNLKRTLLFVNMHLIFSTMKVKENYLSPTKLLQNLHIYLKSLLYLDKSPSKVRWELVISNATFRHCNLQIDKPNTFFLLQIALIKAGIHAKLRKRQTYDSYQGQWKWRSRC